MASVAEFKALTEKVAALQAMVDELKGSKSVKAKKSDDKPKRSNKANEFKEYVFKTAMKDEFDAFVEEAKQTAKDAGEKYNALKARNDFLKSLSDHAKAKLKSDFEALSAAGSAEGSAAASDAEAAPKKVRGGGAKKAPAAAESDVGTASEAEAAPAPKKARAPKKSAASDVGSASEAEAAPATAAPAPAPAPAPAAAGAAAGAAAEEKPAEKKIIRRRKVEVSEKADE